jgi:protease-4
MRRMLAALGAMIGRWYVLAALVTAVGVAVAYLVFFNIYPGRPQIEIIDIPFTVIDEDSAFVIGKMLDYAEETDSIKGVVIKLVTPGGGAAESEALYLKIKRLREKKPVVIATGWLNASGGMFMSMGANYIYVTSGSFVGSVGIILGLNPPPPPNEFVISSGPAKLTGGTDREFTGMMEILKEEFVQTVVRERGDRLRIKPEQVAEARLYVGSEGVRLGLVDAIGSDSDAIEKAASLAGVSNYELVDVNEQVFREFVLQSRRILAPSNVEEPQIGMGEIVKLRAMASAANGSGGQAGVPPDFPIDVNLPRMYYLYVTPNE